MSLPILVAIVVVGISLIVAAVHLTGGSATAVVAGEDHARQLFCADFPDETLETVVITADRHSAFLALPEGRTGIVQSFGDGFVTRIAAPKDVAAITLRAPATVSIRFRDFTWTGGQFRFTEDGAARMIAAGLDPAGPEQRTDA